MLFRNFKAIVDKAPRAVLQRAATARPRPTLDLQNLEIKTRYPGLIDEVRTADRCNLATPGPGAYRLDIFEADLRYVTV